MIKEIRDGGKEKFKNQNAKIKDVESAEAGPRLRLSRAGFGAKYLDSRFHGNDNFSIDSSAPSTWFGSFDYAQDRFAHFDTSTVRLRSPQALLSVNKLSAGGTGKTTAEMKTKSTFTDAGWDFIEIWGIGENQTYPYLRFGPGGDLNYDKKVNLIDVAILASHWLEEN
jgi:hypothetical protein